MSPLKKEERRIKNRKKKKKKRKEKEKKKKKKVSSVHGQAKDKKEKGKKKGDHVDVGAAVILVKLPGVVVGAGVVNIGAAEELAEAAAAAPWEATTAQGMTMKMTTVNNKAMHPISNAYWLFDSSLRRCSGRYCCAIFFFFFFREGEKNERERDLRPPKNQCVRFQK